jgi:hypothetical protein
MKGSGRKIALDSFTMLSKPFCQGRRDEAAQKAAMEDNRAESRLKVGKKLIEEGNVSASRFRLESLIKDYHTARPRQKPRRYWSHLSETSSTTGSLYSSGCSQTPLSHSRTNVD